MNNIRERFSKKNCTQLGVGPMSKNCVDAAIELAHEYDVPLMLIASRRQVECLELGGGYANNWDTFSFAEYVRKKDPQRTVLLARDHGGPWQHPKESQLFTQVEDAMESAKLSFLRDIEAGFQILHIDPVISVGGGAITLEWIMDKVFELYAYCMDVARALGREIIIELGTEEQQEEPLEDPRNLAMLLDGVIEFCDKRGYPRPAFMVVQTGTKVMARRNVGVFPSSKEQIPAYLEKHRIAELVRICEERQVMLKQHNTDYLTDESLRFHPMVGIHAVNVAPEFGVIETLELLRLLEQEGMQEDIATFVEICVASGKWEKWMIPGEDASDREMAIICGHYLFMDETVVAIKAELDVRLQKRDIVLDDLLKAAVKQSIYRYMKCFNLT
jgi:tagatose-1,6-bisphosphate aldolase non-catalytic subunit AgaZ/GatZ